MACALSLPTIWSFEGTVTIRVRTGNGGEVQSATSRTSPILPNNMRVPSIRLAVRNAAFFGSNATRELTLPLHRRGTFVYDNQENKTCNDGVWRAVEICRYKRKDELVVSGLSLGQLGAEQDFSIETPGEFCLRNIAKDISGLALIFLIIYGQIKKGKKTSASSSDLPDFISLLDANSSKMATRLEEFRRAESPKPNLQSIPSRINLSTYRTIAKVLEKFAKNPRIIPIPPMLKKERMEISEIAAELQDIGKKKALQLVPIFDALANTQLMVDGDLGSEEAWEQEAQYQFGYNETMD